MPRASASAGTSEGAPREVRTEVSRLEQERDSGALACGGSISVNDWLRFDYGANRRGGGLGQPSVDNLFTSVYSGRMSRASEVDYDGIAYEDLTVDSVSWSKVVANHMASRTERYGRAQFNVAHPGWATEAATDPDRLVGDGRSRDGATIRVIGWSASSPGQGPLPGRVLKVWLEGDGPAAAGRWLGRSACAANDSDQKYWAGLGKEEDS